MTPKTTTPKTTTPKTDAPKTDAASAKRIADAMAKLTACEYVRKGASATELEAIAATIAALAPLTSDIDAAGGASIDAVVCIRRYSAVSGWQTFAALPVDVHSSKVCPAGNVSADVDPTWYVPASAADIKAAAAGNSNRIHTVMHDNKPLQLKGNARTGQPVKTKMSLKKYFTDYVGADAKAALFAALPAASVDHAKDAAIKAKRWDIALVTTKQVTTSYVG